MEAGDFLLPDEVTSASPSREDGVSSAQETEYRLFAARLLRDAGAMLRQYVGLRIPTIAYVTSFPVPGGPQLAPSSRLLRQRVVGNGANNRRCRASPPARAGPRRASQPRRRFSTGFFFDAHSSV